MNKNKLLSVSAKCLFATVLAVSFSVLTYAQDGLIVTGQSGTSSLSFANVYKLNFVNETMTAISPSGTEVQSFSLASTHSIVFGKVNISSVKEPSMSSRVHVYPTTTSDVLYVNNVKSGTHAVVYSISGLKVIDEKTTDSQHVINVSSLQSGVYILKVDGATFKFNKQ